MTYPAFSFQAALAAVDGVDLGVVESCTLTADAGWSPRWQAQVMLTGIPTRLNPARPAGLPGYVTLTLRRLPGVPTTLADWTTRWGGSTAAMTALGMTGCAPITAATGGTAPAPALPAHQRTAQTLTLTLALRGFTPDLEAGRSHIELASCEMDLQEVVNLTNSPVDYSGLPYADVVLDVLRRCGFTRAQLVTNALWIPDPGNPHFEEGYTKPGEAWQVGESAWDVITRILEPTRGELWADAPDRWHLTNDENLRRLARSAAGRVIAEKVTPTITPFRAQRYGVLHERRTPDGTLVKRTRLGTAGFKRGTYIEETVEPGAPAPANPLPGWRYREGSPHSAKVEAVADLTIRPDWLYPYTVDLGDPEWPLVIGSDPVFEPTAITQIAWEYPAGRMVFEVADLGWNVSDISIPGVVIP